MLDHTLKKKGALPKMKGTFLLQCLAAFCVLDSASAATEPSWAAELVAMEERHDAQLVAMEKRHAAQLVAIEERHETRVTAVRSELYEQLQDVRQCSGCMSPSPPPPSPSPPPPSPPSVG